jgi:RluA family pseudouridine synthase
MDLREIDEARIAQSFFSRYWRWEISEEELFERSIVAELTRRLPHIDTSTWPERFLLGGVYLAGRSVDASAQIVPPCRLEYYEPNIPLEVVATFYPAFNTSSILYHDDDLAVVAKPDGLPTTPARDQVRYNLQRYLSEHFVKPVHMPSRLDTAVSGILLCSLSSRANRYFQKAYERHWIEKYYLAEIAGVPKWEHCRVQRALTRDARHPVLRRCVLDPEVGESAETKLTRLSSFQADDGVRSVLQAEPLTGRTHQIRVHCRSEGFPIVGDPFYGGLPAQTLHLASYGVRFRHPYRNQMMTYELPPPLQPEWLRSIAARANGISLRLREQ